MGRHDSRLSALVEALEGWLAKASESGKRSCPDCGVKSGELHELFCTIERCPFCGGQLASCECIKAVLELSDEESRLVDEYEDDSVDPLRGIVQRWIKTLEREGRIPWQA